MSSILALDVGEVRIGVARANSIARFAQPLTTIINDENVYATISNLINQEEAELIVVGLPRNLSGDDTAQTNYVRSFTDGLGDVTVVFQDEALTSRKAEAELNAKGKPFVKSDIDALAATYILEDYLNSHQS